MREKLLKQVRRGCTHLEFQHSIGRCRGIVSSRRGGRRGRGNARGESKRSQGKVLLWTGVWGVAQWIKHLLRKCEAQSSNPQQPHKKPGRCCSCLESQHLEAETGVLRGTQYLGRIGGSRVQEQTASTIQWREMEEDSGHQPRHHAHITCTTCTNTCAHTRTHTHTTHIHMQRKKKNKCEVKKNYLKENTRNISRDRGSEPETRS